jgi:hypothetical protein
MAKPIPTTKPTRKPENNTKHQRGDENGLKLTGPVYRIKGVSNYSYVHLTRIFRQYIMILRCVLVFVDSSLLVFSLSPNSTVSAPNTPSPTLLYVYRASSYTLSLILAP